MTSKRGPERLEGLMSTVGEYPEWQEPTDYIRVDPKSKSVQNLEYRAGFIAALEEAARLCERPRVRQWSPQECAWKIREISPS